MFNSIIFSLHKYPQNFRYDFVPKLSENALSKYCSPLFYSIKVQNPSPVGSLMSSNSFLRLTMTNSFPFIVLGHSFLEICLIEVRGLPFCILANLYWRLQYFSLFFLSVSVSLSQKYNDSNPYKNSGTPPTPLTMLYLGGQRGLFSKVVLVFRNFRYDLWEVGGDFWRWLCRHVWRKISASVAGGPSGGSCVRRPGSEDPHRR